MCKRKRSKSKDSDYRDILRKVKKLESKLMKRRRLSSSVSVESNQSYKGYYDTYNNCDYDADLPGENISDNVIDINDEPQTETAEPIAGPSAPLTAPAPTPAPMPAVLGSANVNADEVLAASIPDDNRLSLDPEILQLLGEDPTNRKDCGENLHKDIASRWTHILANGISKETQLELIKSYLPPENCQNMRAPKLNLEIKAALTEMNIKKDLFSQSKQNQLASSLVGIGRTLNWALTPNTAVPQEVIKSLSDAGRLICDIHYKESLSRRFVALSTLNRNVRDTVKDTNIDEQLFGSGLSDHIKSSKAITKTGSEIKQRNQRPAYRTPTITQPRGALNSMGAPLRVPSAVEPRLTPAAVRRPPRDRRQEAARGRRPAYNTRHQTRRR